MKMLIIRSLLIIFGVLEGILAIWYPETFFTPANVLIFPICILTGFVLTFVYHRDLAVISWLLGPTVLAEKYRPDAENEHDVFFERISTGSYNRFEPAWHNVVQLRLTDRRFIARFIFSRKGLCLLDIDISDITNLEIPKLPKFFGGRFLKINVVGIEKVRSFNLQTHRSSGWIDAFKSVGVKIKE